MDDAAWRDAVSRDLKGRPVERLTWRPEPEIAVGPLCADEVPSSRGTPRRGWEVLAPIAGDPVAIARAAKAALEGGAEALRIDLMQVRNARDLSVALLPVDLARTPVELAGDVGPGAAAGVVALWRTRKLPDVELRVDFGLDPLGELGQTGGLMGSPEKQLAAAADLGRWCVAHAPHARAFTIDAARWHAAGGEASWCVALAVAGGVAAVRAMETAGVPVKAAFGQVRVRHAVGSRFLLGAATLRATRRIWARIAELAGVDAMLALSAVPASRERSRYSAPTNALRQTSATFGAVIGGANRIEASLLSGEHGARLARNLQLVLREEAHLGAVADPGGGSYALEALTEQVARAAWERLQRIEAVGGLAAALQSGLVVQALRAGRERLQERVRTRQEPVLGVSRYPDATEPTPARDDTPEAATAVPGGLDPVARFDDLVLEARAAPLGALSQAMVGDGLTRCPAAEPFRLAEPFEDLRDRPPRSVAVVTAGSLAEHGARTSWGVELLQAGGLTAEVRDTAAGPGRVAVVSAPDALLSTAAVELTAALTVAGAAVWVLGRPGESESALRAAGAKGFLHMGIDVLAALQTLHAEASR